MPLTAKQEKFAQEIALGKEKSEAYRLAYNAEKMKPEAIHVNASKLANNAKVALRIEELQKVHQERSEKENGFTFDGQMNKLEKVISKAGEKERFSDVISAIKEQNKMLGYYEKDNTQKTTNVNISPIEWVEHPE